MQTGAPGNADDVELARFLKDYVFAIDAKGVGPDELRRVAAEIAETLVRLRSEPIADLAWDAETPS